MATLQQYLDAAKILPAHRDTATQALVDAGKNIQAVRNQDHAAKEYQRVHGTGSRTCS